MPMARLVTPAYGYLANKDIILEYGGSNHGRKSSLPAAGFDLVLPRAEFKHGLTMHIIQPTKHNEVGERDRALYHRTVVVLCLYVPWMRTTQKNCARGL